MAFNNPLAVTIAVGGKLQASLPAAVRQANLQLMALNRTAIRVNENMAHIGRRMVTGLLGVAGITGLVELARESVEVAKEEAATRLALSNIIANQNRLRGVGLQQSKEQVELLERQAKVLQTQSGIRKDQILRGDTLLAQFKLTTRQIMAAQPAMMDLLTYQKLMGRGAESTAETYTGIGKALMGQAKGLRSIGVELNAQQLQYLKINALTGNYAASMEMITAEIERQHRGAATAYMATLGGQAARAIAEIREAKGIVGVPLKDLIGFAQVAVSRFITPLARMLGFEDMHKLIMSRWQEWVKYIDQKLVPAFLKLVKQGWGLLTNAIKYFKDNSNWLVPLLKNVALGFGAWVFVIQPLVGLLTSLANPLNLVLTLITAIGAAVGFAIVNFRGFRSMTEQLGDWLCGTKFLDPKNQGYGTGVMRAFPAGRAPRAMPVYKGWLAEMLKNLDYWESNEFEPHLLEWLQSIGKIIIYWAKNLGLTLWDELVREWKEMRLPSGPGWGAWGKAGAAGQSYGRSAAMPRGFSRVWEQYPWEGKSSNFGPKNITGRRPFLGVPNEIGLGPILQRQWGVSTYTGNDWVKVQFADGTIMWRRLMETSAARGGRGVEFWSAQRGQYERHGGVRILEVRHGTPPEMRGTGTSRGVGGGDITINYSPTYNHSGTTLDEHALAHIHRRHIDQMKRDLAEVIYLNNKSSFDGARAV